MSLQATETLARLVGQKRATLEQLCAVARRQAELIATGEVGELIRLLTDKQRLINALGDLEKGLAAFRHDDPDQRAWPNAQSRAACAAEAQQCERLLAQLIATEQQHERLLTDRRDAVNEQLHKAHSAHRAASAYQNHQSNAAPSVLLDTAPAPSPLDLSSGE